MKSREFYWLLITSYTEEQSGVKRWNKIVYVTMDKESWQTVFASFRITSKDMKLREFHFKFLHRTTVTKRKKKLFRFGLKADGNCLYCGEPYHYTVIQC